MRERNIRRLSIAALCCLAALNGPAQAGLFDDDEARRRIESLQQDMNTRLLDQDARLKKLETLLQTQLSLVNQLEAIRQEIANIRGQLEVQANNIGQTQKRQQDFYVDLDNRLRKLESGAQQAVASAPAAQPAVAGTEAQDYEAGLNALKAGKNIDAAVNLKTFIRNYPKSSYLPSANFWLGAAYAQLKDSASARDTYAKMAETWPDDPLAPDALLGQADAQQALKETRGARTTLEALVAKYPNSDAAKTARNRLGKK